MDSHTLPLKQNIKQPRAHTCSHMLTVHTHTPLHASTLTHTHLALHTETQQYTHRGWCDIPYTSDWGGVVYPIGLIGVV